jgi:hypothetical protein
MEYRRLDILGVLPQVIDTIYKDGTFKSGRIVPWNPFLFSTFRDTVRSYPVPLEPWHERRVDSYFTPALETQQQLSQLCL